MGLCFGDEGFGFKLSGKEREEDGFLVKGFDGRKGDSLGAFDELIRLRHVEDEFVADEFGGSVVGVGTLQPDIIRHNRRRTINSPNNGEWRMVNGEWQPPEVNSPLHRESVTNEESQK